MPKKQVKNAFYFYMKELEPQLKREGRVFPHGMADIVPIAHPRWKILPEKEKERFEKISKEYKAKMRGAEGDKYRQDNTRTLLSERRDEFAELQKRRTKERNCVKSQWPTGKLLASEKFYLLNIQTLCKTDDGDYLPCEIGAIEYSIKSGITKTLHRFIEPGRIPTGYRYECKSKSEDTHKIPIERFEKSDANYRGLWIQLENFVNPNGEKPEYPPFYCMGTDVEELEYCLNWVHDKACLGYANRLRRVYNLEGLVQDLFGHIGHSVSETQVIDLMTAHTWDFEPKTRCDFHEELECKFCSLGLVNRYAYAISDSVCPLYGVQITPKHLPIREEGSVSCVVLPPSSMKIDMNQQARMPSRRPMNDNRPPQQQTFQPAPTNRYAPTLNRGGDSDDDDDDEDDEEYTSLRRPHNPAYTGMGGTPGGAGRGLASLAPWSGVPVRPQTTPNIIDQNSFPSLGGSQPNMAPPGLSGIGRGNPIAGIGRGAPVAQIINTDQKFAGRAMAPEPTFAPPPPASWQKDVKEPQKITMADISRGLQQSSVAPERNGQSGVNLSQFQDRMVQSMQYNGSVPTFPTSVHQQQRSQSNVQGGMMGQFQGILGNLQKDKKLPMGRGYAPPGAGDISQMVGQMKIQN
ncbi:protein maelstrom homolog [Mytilus californianus]|uniref:protein maelstrom homolog n=1 Tax=Mytilus californianus TaxID=6549 RepID=UPI002247673C|nr:protein maelstrom homolog [Mytilus californianus]